MDTPNQEQPTDQQVAEHLDQQLSGITAPEATPVAPVETPPAEEVNQSEESKPDLTKERDDRCIPVAKLILKLIADSDLKLGSMNSQDLIDSNASIAEKILALFLDQNVFVGEIDYIFTLAQQAYINSQYLVVRSYNHTKETCDTKLWGKTLTELQISDINKVSKQ